MVAERGLKQGIQLGGTIIIQVRDNLDVDQVAVEVV